MREKPIVSIITVNYNQSEATCQLLDNLKDISYQYIEVIVIDNHSPNDTPEIIKERHPWVIYHRTGRNLGFAGGNNVGVRLAKGDLVLFINNDTEVSRNFLEPLVDLFKEHPEAGMASPKIKFYDNPDLIQYAGLTKMDPYTIRNKGIGYMKEESPELNKFVETEAVHGAAMMVPMEVIREVGLMPEVYFLYYEEIDWSESIKRAGYKIYYQPASYILHKESLSTGRDSAFKTYYLNRNRIVFARRNYAGFQFWVSLFFQLFVSIPKNAFMFLIKGKFDHFFAYTRAILWNLFHWKEIQGNPKL